MIVLCRSLALPAEAHAHPALLLRLCRSLSWCWSGFRLGGSCSLLGRCRWVNGDLAGMCEVCAWLGHSAHSMHRAIS